MKNLDLDTLIIMIAIVLSVIIGSIALLINSKMNINKEIKVKEYEYKIEQIKVYGEEMNYGE